MSPSLNLENQDIIVYTLFILKFENIFEKLTSKHVNYFGLYSSSTGSSIMYFFLF